MMSSQWLHVSVQPLPVAWSYGDVTCKYFIRYTYLIANSPTYTDTDSVSFSLSGPSTTIIVLSQLDSRYYRDVAGRASWTMDFTLVKEGQKEPIADSGHSDFYLRSVHLEVELEAGNYIVYVGKSFSFRRKEKRVPIETSYDLLGSFGSNIGS